MEVELIVQGEPVPWQRARRKGNRYFTDPKVADYQERVRVAWMVAGRLSFGDAPVRLARAQFVFGRKRSHMRSGRNSHLVSGSAPTHPEPDLDNLEKGVCDALNTLLYKDDRQIVSKGETEKCFARGDEESHTLLVFEAV